MKQFYRITCAFISLFIMLVFAGCSKNTTSVENGETTWVLSEEEPQYVTEWPENEFTARIIEPENGKIDYVYDYSDSGRYAVCIKDISEEESAAYIGELERLGYSEVVSDGNDMSAGMLMKKDDTVLSISYSENVMGILITIENEI